MASPGDEARRIKEEATALHRAGQYEEAAEEFARAAQLLEEAGVGLEPPPALSAIRLSLAASQLKVCHAYVGLVVVQQYGPAIYKNVVKAQLCISTPRSRSYRIPEFTIHR